MSDRDNTAKMVAEKRQHRCHYAEGTCDECCALADRAHDAMREWYGYECNDSQMVSHFALLGIARARAEATPPALDGSSFDMVERIAEAIFDAIWEKTGRAWPRWKDADAP